MNQKIRSYDELIKLKTFEERFEYLKLDGIVGKDTFGFDRYLNQDFYRSEEWKHIRDFVIVRDYGRDLGIEGREIYKYIVVHHMNPLTIYDLQHSTDFLLNPNFLICTSSNTHRALHYGSVEVLVRDPIQRKPNDTCPWKT